MNTSELQYLGELRTEATHVFSGTKILTDAPLDNHGKAEAFSPTDLVATALAACIITTMGIKARDMQIDLAGTTLKVVKTMAPDPRRISRIDVALDIPLKGLSKAQKEILERTAHHCPVAKSLHPDLVQAIIFNYAD